MELFNFGKKKKEPEIKKPSDFYTLCVEDYHRTLKEMGYANRGLIFIPELIPMGNKAVLAYLKDPFFKAEVGGNVTQYYYLICSLSFMTGVAYAEKWHSNFAALKAGFVDQVIADGPADYAIPILEKELHLSSDQQSEKLYSIIFDRWLILHEPYWKLSDPREYTFNAMLAAYQAGISVILEKHGY